MNIVTAVFLVLLILFIVWALFNFFKGFGLIIAVALLFSVLLLWFFDPVGYIGDLLESSGLSWGR